VILRKGCRFVRLCVCVRARLFSSLLHSTHPLDRCQDLSVSYVCRFSYLPLYRPNQLPTHLGTAHIRIFLHTSTSIQQGYVMQHHSKCFYINITENSVHSRTSPSSITIDQETGYKFVSIEKGISRRERREQANKMEAEGGSDGGRERRLWPRLNTWETFGGSNVWRTASHRNMVTKARLKMPKSVGAFSRKKYTPTRASAVDDAASSFTTIQSLH
jgi:hypothetical protein